MYIKNYKGMLLSAVLLTLYMDISTRSTVTIPTTVTQPQGRPAAPMAPRTPQTQPISAPSVTPVQPSTQAQPIVSRVQPTRTIPITKKHEKYTQTQAYLEVPKLRELVTNSFGGDFQPVKHMDIISRVMAVEADLRDTHWAFYHGVSNVWTVWQDTYTELFNHFYPNKAKEGDSDFIFLRARGKANITATDFLVDSLKEYGLVDDNGKQKAVLLATNMFLFGNSKIQGESTWKYMMTDKTHERPSRNLYKSIMDEFNVSDQYIDELMSLVNLLKARQQTLLQIFVPKNLIDDVGYVSWTRGIPAHEASISWVKKSGIRGEGGETGAVRALGILRNTFKKEQEKNPLFAEMLETIQNGGYSIDDFLTKCCNDPLNVPNMDGLQARLIFTDDILLNPGSGVKMYRYSGIDYHTMQNYKKQLNAIIKKIIATKK
jgi:hypothetical protein